MRPIIVIFAIFFAGLFCLAQSRPATQPAIDIYALSADDFFKLPSTSARIGKNSADTGLLEAAIFLQTNRERAKNKLKLFKHGWAPQLMARLHSAEMAELKYFDHESPTPANRTLADRFKNAGLFNVTGGENIAVLPAKEMGSGHYIIRDNPDGSETWTDASDGKVIDYYTYAELSAAVVKQWMDSPPHRQNILDPRFNYLGVGIARGIYDRGQDSFYMTQNFSSGITPASENKAMEQLVPPAPPATTRSK